MKALRLDLPRPRAVDHHAAAAARARQSCAVCGVIALYRRRWARHWAASHMVRRGLTTTATGPTTRAHLAFRRLSIIDLSARPSADGDGSRWWHREYISDGCAGSARAFSSGNVHTEVVLAALDAG